MSEWGMTQSTRRRLREEKARREAAITQLESETEKARLYDRERRKAENRARRERARAIGKKWW